MSTGLALGQLAQRTTHSILFTFAPRTRLLTAMPSAKWAA
jgi:hypothetical protein